MSTLPAKATLAPLDVEHRLERLTSRLDDAGCDALLVTKLENVRYLTGFSGSAGALIVNAKQSTLITDGRYKDQAAAEVEASRAPVQVEISGARSRSEAILAGLSGAIHVGLEADWCSWSEQRHLAEQLGDVELVATSKLVETLRRVKDEGEIARIAYACAIADEALGRVKNKIAERVRESDFAAALEYEMRLLGSEAPAFSTIVASGPNSARPHARPTDRVIGEGDLVVVDFGATVQGYRSDMTRTFCAGTPTPELAALIEAVFEAQRAGVEAVSVGASCGSVDAACRDLLTSAGFGEQFLHSTGHGVGLEIHEAPWVASGSADILGANTVVTVEPGAYLSGRGGVRIEDTVVVTDNGTRTLTSSTKDYSI